MYSPSPKSEIDLITIAHYMDISSNMIQRWYGSHTELAYSRVGLTRDMYAFSLIDLLEMFMFLLRKLMVLLALEQMVLIYHGQKIQQNK
jgi:hypothetical protein